MEAQVDFHEWAEYALQGSPAVQSGLLNLSPVVQVQGDIVVCEVLSNALQPLTKGILNENIRSACDQYLGENGTVPFF